MKNNLTITRAQAGALARLIQSHLDAYDEAAPLPKTCKAAAPHGKTSEPFNGGDLDLIEPLVVLLEKLARP